MGQEESNVVQPIDNIEVTDFSPVVGHGNVFGIKKIENCSYFSSLMQCLFHLNEFQHSVIIYYRTLKKVRARGLKKNMVYYIGATYERIIQARKKRFPREESFEGLVSRISPLQVMFDDKTPHHDAGFLSYLISEVEKCFQKIERFDIETGDQLMKSHGKNFVGKLSHTRKCMICEEVVGSPEAFSVIDIKSEYLEDNISIIHCLRKYYSFQRRLGRSKPYCRNCRTFQEAFEWKVFTELPEILIINLNRYCEKEFRRKDFRILVPFNIRIANFLPQKGSEDMSNRYELVSFINHIVDDNGEESGYGTYEAIVRVSRTWIKFVEDEFVEITREEVSKYFEDSQIYSTNILFYRRS